MSSNSHVPEQVLQWLYANLTRERYQHVNHAYSHIVHALSNFPSVKPRTELFTFNDGAQSLLVLLKGTLSTGFMGAVYHFPVKLWIPHSYPREPPLVFVIPEGDLQIRTGQHVSPEGRIYHPYLAQWGENWQTKNVTDLLITLRDVFGREPPLSARPPPPPNFATSGTARKSETVFSNAPPLPPKLHSQEPSSNTVKYSARAPTDASPPPLPPKPGSGGMLPSTPQANGHAMLHSARSNSFAQQHFTSRQEWQNNTQFPDNPNDPRNTRSPVTSAYTSQTPDYSVHSRPMQPSTISMANTTYGDVESQHLSQMHYHYDRSQGQRSVAPSQVPPYAVIHHQTSSSRSKRPPQDIMDMPLEVTLPSQHGHVNAAAPPIPPNPEKNALLEAISVRLRSELQSTVAQNRGAIIALQGQHSALHQAQHYMQTEINQLDSLNDMLSENEKILNKSMRDAGRIMEKAGRRELPDVDELLIAPTAVGEQLYRLVAEERSISDALFVLAKALDRGRVAPDVFVRHTRALAREQFLKKVIIKKAAQGMGLDERH